MSPITRSVPTFKKRRKYLPAKPTGRRCSIDGQLAHFVAWRFRDLVDGCKEAEHWLALKVPFVTHRTIIFALKA